jgi:hypothetical protein
MIELGIAIALDKAIFLFRDDFRRCTDSEYYPLNLMVFAGLPEANWQDYYYTQVEDIDSPSKALYNYPTLSLKLLVTNLLKVNAIA